MPALFMSKGGLARLAQMVHGGDRQELGLGISSRRIVSHHPSLLQLAC